MVTNNSGWQPREHIVRFLEASATWLLAMADPKNPPADAQPPLSGLEVQDSSWAEWDRACQRWEQRGQYQSPQG